MKWLGKAKVTEKNPGDLVTQADFESQQVIAEFIQKKYPQHTFLGEEDDGSLDQLDQTGFCWIVDPLDGTSNYVHQMRGFCVSIALAWRGEVIAAAVFAPSLDECFSAAQGQGATYNGQPIQASQCTNVSDALLVCSFKSRVGVDDPEIQRFARVVAQALSVRRLGSAALNLCYVAAGRLDGYWASSLKIWDVAAGVLILRESGGYARHISGTEFRLSEPRLLVTSTPQLNRVLLELLETGEPVD